MKACQSGRLSMPVSIVRKLLGLALLSLLSFSTLAQTEDQQHETIKIKTDLVALDALVTDKKTREVIRNLTLQDSRSNISARTNCLFPSSCCWTSARASTR